VATRYGVSLGLIRREKRTRRPQWMTNSACTQQSIAAAAAASVEREAEAPEALGHRRDGTFIRSCGRLKFVTPIDPRRRSALQRFPEMSFQ